MTLVSKDAVIAALLDIARLARERMMVKFAELDHLDAATRRKLEREIATALDQLDAMVERMVGELRGTAGHA
jgi:hypothetical protein